MSFGRVPALTLSIALCVALLAALLPAATLAAPGGKPRDYIVTLDVAGSDRTIAPSNKTNKARIRQRASRAEEASKRVARDYGVKTKHRYGNAFTGFSSTMTRAQAAKVASDPAVANVRLARTFRVASEVIPNGIKRVKAWTAGTTPGPDVNAHVAVLDTGIGPAQQNGEPIAMTPPGSEELNIRGGVNCYDDPLTVVNEATQFPGRWGDTYGHGTHVAGIIGARDNAVGVIGVAPGAKLWSVRVFQGDEGSEAALLCGLTWAIDTHLDAQPDIDVINMSIQGPRLDFQEHCPTIQADSDADPLQKLICTATLDYDISVVAAAGNSGINANKSSPGGFDQVISVGALNDFDGEGWGSGPKGNCSGYQSQVDDTFAGYSNHGPEIDIVAPGTCVSSTSYFDRSGDSRITLSGTSMAAPHVSGAVARYLADHPGTPAGEMRNLVRATGRMDWDAKSDPVWSGVNDTDVPNRVLDVKALNGANLVRVWAYHDAFKVGGTSKTRTTRVDVQRGGGYGGTVNLRVTGLPGTVGTGAFGDSSLNRLGRANLGTNLTLNLKTSGPDGVYGLGIVANGAGVDPHSRALSLTVDRTAPSVIGFGPRIRGSRATMAASGAAQVYLKWTASDALSSVKSAQLQRKTGTQAWRNAGSGGTISSRVTLKPGQDNKFRVKVADSLGNSKTTKAISARLSVRDSKSTQWQKPASGGWKTKKVAKAFGGSVLLANGATGSLTTKLTGKAIAVVGSIGPGRGTFRLRIDGGQWYTVNLKASKAGHRRVVWSREVPYATHTVEVQGLTGQTALDALLVVR